MNPSSKKFLKVIGIILGIIIVLLIAATVTAKIIFTKEKILAYALPKIEQALNRKVTVEDASISIWGGIGIEIKGVTIENLPGFKEKNLLTLDEFSVGVKFWPLLKKRIELKKLTLDKPILNLEKKTAELTNYDDLLATRGGPILLPASFEKFELKEGRIIYLNSHQNSQIIIHDLSQESKSNFNPSVSEFSTHGEIKVKSLEVFSPKLSKNYDIPLALEYDLAYNLKGDSLSINKVLLTWNKNKIKLQGRGTQLTKQPQIVLKINSDGINIENLLSLVPPNLLKQNLNSSGQLNVKAEGKWDLKTSFYPTELNGRLIGKDLKIQSGKTKSAVTIPVLESNFTNNSIILSTSQARFGNNPLQLKAVVSNLKAPELSAEFSSKLNLAIVPEFITLPEGTTLAGNLDVKGKVFGKMKSFENLNFSGDLNLQDIKISSPNLNKPLEKLNGNLKIADGNLNVNRLSATSGKSSFVINGECKKLIPYILNKDKATPKPLFTFNLTSNYLDLDELIPPKAPTAPESKITPANKPSLYLALGVATNLQGTVSADSLLFRKVTTKSFKAEVSLINGIINIKTDNSRIFQGLIEGQVNADLNNPENIKFDIKVKATNIEVNDFLSRFTKIDNRLFGKFNLDANFTSQGFSEEEILKSLTASGTGVLSEGKLVNFDFFNKLGNFLKLDNYQEEPIKMLKNSFKIVNQRVFFENFDAVSKTGDWKLAGSIGLDQSLDYLLNIKFSPEVSKKLEAEFTKQFGNLGNMAQYFKDEQGRIDLPIKIGGTANDPKFMIDTSVAQKKFQDSLKNKLQDKKEDNKKKVEDFLQGVLKKKP